MDGEVDVVDWSKTARFGSILCVMMVAHRMDMKVRSVDIGSVLSQSSPILTLLTDDHSFEFGLTPSLRSSYYQQFK